MDIYCIEEFKNEYERLIRKKSYKELEKEIIEHFLLGDPQSIITGKRLNNSADRPYIKKRLDGSGGYRVYFYAVIYNECIYLMFVHPKTGSLGGENITDEAKAMFYKSVLHCIENRLLYKLSHIERERIVFTKIEQ
ncbi:hypothetical protein [Emticicia sp. C21]|uniref:hypothetical protein n=1 Tax=Emticicia sp. C21 TaxID=2302915 RepID=UPI000E34982A|nr:hypothetical protein [Emticicia sp. C21]RFS16082.1 hypothetical protein D0T08_14430 [Emticicia sp. C21]